MPETIVLDPSAVATGRTQVDITRYIDQKGPEWGDADSTSYKAQTKYGSRQVDHINANRSAVIPLVFKGTTFSTIRNQVQQKVGLWQNQGGWIMRRVGGTPLYADVVTAVLHLGGSIFQAFKGFDTDAVLSVEYIPEWYGDEITLSTLSSGGVLNQLLQLSGNATINGNLPGRIRLQVNETNGFDLKGLLWGFRSKYFDQSSTAALVIECENMSPLNGAGVGVPSVDPPSGFIYAGVVHAGLPASSWVSILLTTLGGAAGGVATGAGWQGTDNAGVGTIAWSSPGNVSPGFGTGTTGAFCSLAATNATHYLVTGTHQFAIPSTATINGIVVQLQRWTANGLVTDTNVKLVKNSVIQTTNKSAGGTWSTNPTSVPVSFGGSADLWGTTWTPADINNANFGVAVSATASGTDTAHLVRLTVTVFYTPVGTDIQPLTHQGSYRVWGRVMADGLGAKVKLQWGIGSLVVPVANDPVQVPGADVYYMIDFGVISLDPTPIAPNQWFGIIQAQVPTANMMVSVDKLYFQPLDETSGKLQYTNVPPVSSIQVDAPTPTAAVDDSSIGTVAWSNPTNVFASDGAVASVSLAPNIVSHYVKITGFGFSIPTTATVLGVELFTEASLSPSWAGTPSQQITPRLVFAGAIQSARGPFVLNGNLEGTSGFGLSIISFGNATDLWGGAPGSILATDVNNSGFGIAISYGPYFVTTVAISLDYVHMRVWYSLASGLVIASDAVVYANKTTEIRTDGILRASGTNNVYGPVSTKIGDLPRVPISGLEGRQVELFVKASRGDLDQLPDTWGAITTFTVTPKYRPVYLFTGE